ncbi:MAG: L-threonylcarbamoyladenylate synthase, partial [Planctomycetaceae bacterium]
MPGASGRVAERLSSAQVARAAELLRNGGIGAFPTETVYGLGADLFQPAAIARVFAVKG